jgi:hypothetical protein
MARNVLVVSTVEHPEARLRALLGADVEEIKVVVPVVQQGFLDWLANDEEARAEAEDAAGRIAAALPGDTVEAQAGEADVPLAIRDALATFPADEVVLVTRPDANTTWLEDDARSQPAAIDGVPVRRLVISEPA